MVYFVLLATISNSTLASEARMLQKQQILCVWLVLEELKLDDGIFVGIYVHG